MGLKHATIRLLETLVDDGEYVVIEVTLWSGLLIKLAESAMAVSSRG